MTRKFVDLSIYLENDVLSDPPAFAPKIQYFTHDNTFEQIERNYVTDVDRRKLLEAAVRGMLEELDPYSNYISPEDLSRFTAQVEQEFGGIGIQVMIDDATRRLMVTSPLPGTPAYKAGLRPGDLIMEIEDRFEIDIPINLVSDMTTVADLAALVERQIKSRKGG